MLTPPLHGNTLIPPSLRRSGVLKYVSNAAIILRGEEEEREHSMLEDSSPPPHRSPIPRSLSSSLRDYLPAALLGNIRKVREASPWALPVSLCFPLSSIWQLLLHFIELISGNYRLLQLIKAPLREVVGLIPTGTLLCKGPLHCFQTHSQLSPGRLHSRESCWRH